MIRSHARESTIAGTAHRKHALLASAAPTPAEPETATARAGHSPRPRYSGICLSPSRGAARDQAIALPVAGWRLRCLGEITHCAATRGRASCRGSVGPYVEISVVAGSLKKKK